MRFISPFTDFGFKKIFGEEPNKDILIDFLNQILALENVQIKDLTYKKTEFTGITDLDRKVIFDLFCENEKGEKFIVEMQKVKQTFFKDRTLFYSTFPIQEQAIKGEWNYELKSLYCVAVLGFTFDDEDGEKPIVKRVKLIDQDTHKVFYNKLNFIFIQMPAFNKEIHELETRLDQWLYLLKHLDTFERMPESLKDKIFQKVFQIAQYNQLDDNERMAYQKSLKYYWDTYSIITSAQKEGLEKGYEQGIQQGIQQGIEEGFKIAEEKYEKLLEQEKQQADEKLVYMIKNMIANGFNIEQIKKITSVDDNFLKKYGLL